MSKRNLSHFVKVRGRFQRSVHLVRDWQAQRGLQDYLLTSTAKEIAHQVLEGVSYREGARAWSITGPYGTGKSAFALFLTDLLVNDPPKHPQAKILHDDILNGSHSFLPVLVAGERGAIATAFVRALEESLRGDMPSVARKVARAKRAGHTSNTQIVGLFEETARAASKMGRGGVLFIVDEFGKFLEFAAQHPETEDLLILQELAEVASRSQVPIIFLTILHSAFAEYLDTVDENRRLEWQKVHGRFADIAFLEPPEQFVHLVGEAIEWKGSSSRNGQYRSAVESIVTSPAFEEARRRFPAKDLLSSCVPLHPVTALILWPLFRSKLAQNERSLFAFLNDRGPFGFQEFLELTSVEGDKCSLYALDRLYDYVRGTLGTGRFAGDRARRWAEIEHAIDRADAASPPLTKAVVKCIGLLGLYGRSVGLRASKRTLDLALGDHDAVAEAVEYLEDSSIIVYRRYEDAYALWEGSDVDLEASYTEAPSHAGHGNLAFRLKQVIDILPVVARAHYIRSGTLRYFDVDLIDGDERNIREALHADIRGADGKLVFVLSANKRKRNSLVEFAQQITKGDDPTLQLRVLAFPKPFAGLEESLREVEAWNWVKENVRELQGDPVARQEATTRLAQASRRLEELAGAVLGLRGYPFEPSASEWVQGGSLHEFGSAIEFTKWLSMICDEVFDQAPTLKNELINRENLSSAAAAARRNLIEAMITMEHESELGFQGNPAELTMYRALLQAGGFHRIRKGGYQFGLPGMEWRSVWRVMKEFLETTRTGRRPLVELIARLKEPPLGLRDGPIPVLVAALVLAHRDQIAVYEDGVFLPEPRIEVFERLMRAPTAFEIQLYKLNMRDQKAFEAVGGVLGELELVDSNLVGEKLLSVVRPLVLFAAHLPVFTKRTKHIEPIQAADVRDVLLRSRDPYALLFEELPDALGVSVTNRATVEVFADSLRACLIALRRAYPRLLDRIELQVREAFDLDGSSRGAREKLRSRAEPLAAYVPDPSLGLFVREASRLDNTRDWREALARAVSKGRPATNWTDADAVQFQARLATIASDFLKLEELVAEQRRAKTGPILRIGLLDGKFEEARVVVSPPAGREQEVKELAHRIIQILEDDRESTDDGKRVRVAALAKAVEIILRGREV
jgi:hypothetical protein